MRFLFILLGLQLTTPAFADSVNVQLYRSPFNLNYGMVESAIPDSLPWEEAAANPKIFFSANYHYAKDPLVVINTTTGRRASTVVNHIHTTDLALGYFLSPEFSLYGQLPLHLSAVPGGTNQFDIGDSRFAGKYRLSEKSSTYAFSLMPELTLPTGNSARFLSDNSFGVGGLFIAENDFGNFRVSGNVGYRFNSKAQFSNINYKHRIPLALGLAVPLSRKLAFNADVSGALALPTSQQQNASEFYLGLNYHPQKHIAAILGASVGAFNPASSLDYRLQAALRMYFDDAPAPVQRTIPAPFEDDTPAPKARMVENRIEITEEIQFEHNKDRLLNSSKLVLDEVANIIRKNGDAMKWVEVEGHTSLVGTEAYNDKLSLRRSRTVVKYLVEEKGISPKKLKAKGYGEQRPKFLPGRATEAELERNRRVEFNVVRE
jgi:outer membrane protein OmpA-like peptidoglycan-associated protein